MTHEDGQTGSSPQSDNRDAESRPAKPGDTDTTRFGMEDGDNTDVPSTGVDPEQQSKPDPEGSKAP